VQLELDYPDLIKRSRSGETIRVFDEVCVKRIEDDEPEEESEEESEEPEEESEEDDDLCDFLSMVRSHFKDDQNSK
jgi:hypothetical protein